MADRLELIVRTPKGIALQINAGYVNIPLEQGSIGVLPNHAPMLCALTGGVLKFRREDGEGSIKIGKGAARVEHNKISVLTDTAE